MSDQPDDPSGLTWHPSRHYEEALGLITGQIPSAAPELGALVHGLLMIGLLIEMGQRR